MRAAPIVAGTNDEKGVMVQKEVHQINTVGFPTRVASTFKSDVISSLKTRAKTLYLKFEILNRINLIDSLENGCRIM